MSTRCRINLNLLRCRENSNLRLNSLRHILSPVLYPLNLHLSMIRTHPSRRRDPTHQDIRVASFRTEKPRNLLKWRIFINTQQNFARRAPVVSDPRRVSLLIFLVRKVQDLGPEVSARQPLGKVLLLNYPVKPCLVAPEPYPLYLLWLVCL